MFALKRRSSQFASSAMVLSFAFVSGCAGGTDATSVRDDSPSVSQTKLSEMGFDTVRLSARQTPLFLSGQADATVLDGKSAASVLRERLATAYRLAPQTDFRVLSEQTDEAGFHYIRLSQLHDGIPVPDGEVIFQSDRSGTLLAVIGELVPDVEATVPASAKAPLAAETSVRNALSGLAQRPVQFLDAPSWAIVAPDDRPTAKAQLTHRALVSFVDATGSQLEEVFVSVDHGQIISRRSHVHQALSRELYTLGGKCIGMGGTLPGTASRKEGEPAVADASVNRVYDQQSNTYYFYKHMFARDSYDNKGAKMVATVHVQFPSGFSCSPNNAAWLGSPYFQMAYGDGDGSLLLDLTLGLDVTAHEITHAVTSTSSNLTYINESGALNEAMSDIMGSGVEAWVESGGSTTGNPATLKHSSETWLLGKEVAGPKLPGGSLRFMDNPTKDGQSKDWYPERIMPGGVDRGGVHLNSGMPNLVHVLLTQGGKHPRSKSTVEVTALGLDKSLRIFYLTNNKLLPSNATFETARYATGQAAQTLYGRCTQEFIMAHRAWDVVGVPGVWQPCVRPPIEF